MTFNYDEKSRIMSYSFVTPYQITKSKDVTEMYSVKFLDMFSAKTITIHCTLDTEILKYTLISSRCKKTENIFTEVYSISKNEKI